MKLAALFIALVQANDCTNLESQILSFCQRKGKTLSQKKTLDETKDRYNVQETNYNLLSGCYNDMMNLDWKVSENGWENDGKASECVSLDADCSESKRDCCVKSDWTQLSDNVKEVETWSGQVVAGVEDLLTDIDSYMKCITNRCYE